MRILLEGTENQINNLKAAMDYSPNEMPMLKENIALDCLYTSNDVQALDPDIHEIEALEMMNDALQDDIVTNAISDAIQSRVDDWKTSKYNDVLDSIDKGDMVVWRDSTQNVLIGFVCDVGSYVTINNAAYRDLTHIALPSGKLDIHPKKIINIIKLPSE